MASRSLDDLHPEMRLRTGAFLKDCTAAEIEVLVYCTWRSPAEQDWLYAQGRTREGVIVTWAKAGKSLHNFMLGTVKASKAIDVVPILAGKPIWDGAHPIWKQVAEKGEWAGLVWAGRWPKKKREFPHFQLP